MAAALLAIGIASSALFAQTLSIPDRLPSNTIFYAHWRGRTFGDGTQEKNHLLQLLQDPEVAPFRDALLMASEHGGKKGSAAGSFAYSEFLSLLGNEAAFGVVVNPVPPKTDQDASSEAMASAGAFLVYDATGKTGLIDKLKALQKANAKETPIVKSYDFGGTAVEVRTTSGGSSYTARTGKYFIVSDKKPVVEELIARFRGTEKPASSVTELPDYKAIRPFMGSDSTLEFYIKLPDVDKVVPADSQDAPAVRFARNLHLEKFHVAGGGVSFAGEALRIHGAVLGDATPPGLFDITGASLANFVTLPVVNAGPPFHIMRLDLPATYKLLRAAAMESLTPQQTVYIATGEGMAQAFLGMSVDDALHLFTGEFATESTYNNDGSAAQLFAVSIQKPQDVLRILHAILGKKIVGEETAGTATILDISYPIRDPLTGADKPNLYYVAVTPEMVLVAQRKVLLRAALERANSKSGAAATAAAFSNADLNRLRGQLPEKLSGISAVDLVHFPWDKFFAQLVQQFNEDAKGSKEATQQSADWLKLIMPEAFSRHLHAGLSGWWKDSNGIYFDAYLQ